MSSDTPVRPLYRFASIPSIEDRLSELVQLVEEEDWSYRHTTSPHAHPILYSYLHYTFERLEEEGKLEVSSDGEYAGFNTGLVTDHQESVYMLFQELDGDTHGRPWRFWKICRQGQHELSKFAKLPPLAHYFDDPSLLVFDTRLEIRVNIEHIIEDNKDRFPEPFRAMPDHQLRLLIKGAIDNAVERVKRNYKVAIPQYHRGRVQLLLPLNLSDPRKADIALVADRREGAYRIATCLTLDMAYNNARLLTRPDRDWLQP